MKRTNQAPTEYVEMVYRREFGYTPEEMNKIPAYIVERDLYFMSQEAFTQKIIQGGD